VKTIYVEQGATLCVFCARAKGRGNSINKPTCHVRGRWQLRQDGTKNNPTGFRPSAATGISRWYASNRDFAGMLAEDIKVREYQSEAEKLPCPRVLIEAPCQERTHHDFLGSSGCCDRQKGETLKPSRGTEPSAGRACRRQHRRSAQT
jgi:hypothetical protein